MWTTLLASGKVKYNERYKDPITGKNHDVSVTYPKDTAKNRKEATQILRGKIEALSKPTYEIRTLEDLVEAYRTDQKRTVKESTYKRNYFAADTIMRILNKDARIENMTAHYIRTKFLDTGRDNSTLNELMRRLKAMVRWAYKNELIPSTSLVDRIERFPDRPHADKISDKFMEAEELKKFLTEAKHPIWTDVIEFLCLSGLRSGEMIALTVDDIEDSVIRISKTYDSVNQKVTSAKTQNSVGDVSIQPQLRACIDRILRWRKRQMIECGCRSKLFIFDKHGDHIHYYSLEKWFRENAERILGRKLTLHSTRHTHASLLFEQGFTFDEVSRRLRNDSKVAKEIYVHVTERLKEKDAAKLADVVLF